MFGRRRGYRRGFRGGGGGGLGMVLLAMQLLHLFQFLSSSNDYYPITLGVLGLNLIAFFQPGRNWPTLQQACISVRGAWFDREWKRLFLASFYHTSDFHLYYNMASFIWKAISLERFYGSGYFLYMVAVFSVTTNLVYIGINYALAEILDQWSYINTCAAGFSGVLFALKVVTTHIQPAGMTRVMGFIPVPMRIACWVELVLISALFPHVSFVGHLAGILVGFAFIYGPLRAVMDIPLSLFTGLVPSGSRTGGPHSANGQSYTYRAGTTGHRGAEQQQRAPRPPSQPDVREYHSYTYAAGTSGRGREEREGSEEVELQEAIRRSLTTTESVERENDSTPDVTHTNTQRSETAGGPHETDPSASHSPPPYNPDFPPGPQPDVGWNRDVLEHTEHQQDTQAPPIGFDALNSDPDSASLGTGLRQRRNETRNESQTEGEVGRERDGVGGSLTRKEIREARLLRLGVDGGDRRPLSELSGHTFSFRK